MAAATLAVACSRRVPEEPAAVTHPIAPASAVASAPVPVPPAEVMPGGVQFAVIGDFGADTPAEGEVARMVKGWNPAFVLTVGDNNYPSGEAATIDVNIGKYYAPFIGKYRGAFGKGSEQNRFWPSLGNHDWVTPGAAPYLDYFTLPGNERYYDVNFGLVHIYALDSDAHEPDGITETSAQATWLKRQLSASKSCYDVVYFHHPPYSSGPHGSLSAMRWPFRAWGSEVLFTGHDHTYERFTVDGIPYFVDGLGGASRYEFGEARTEHSDTRFNESYGAMRVTANLREITYEFFTVDGKRHDAVRWAPPEGSCPSSDAGH